MARDDEAIGVLLFCLGVLVYFSVRALEPQPQPPPQAPLAEPSQSNENTEGGKK